MGDEEHGGAVAPRVIKVETSGPFSSTSMVSVAMMQKEATKMARDKKMNITIFSS